MPAHRRSAKDFAIIVLKLAVVVGALSYLIFSDKLKPEYLCLASGKTLFVAGGAVLFLSTMLLSFLRYWLLLRGVGICLSLRNVFRLSFIGAFFNTFMLGALGGDAVKLAYVMRESSKGAAAVASIMVDRVLGLLGLLSLAGVALALSWPEVLANSDLHNLSLLIFGGLGGTGFAVLLSFVVLAKGRGWAGLIWFCFTGATVIFAIMALRGDSLEFWGPGPSKPDSRLA